MANPIPEWSDAFGKQVAVTTNEADIAAHYPFSPERLRLFKNGTRQFVQYNSITGYTDLADAHQLTPQSSGDVFQLETAERYRYVVGYVLEWSGALSASQALQSGDAVIFGYGDPDLANSSDDFPGPSADGWFLHWHSGLESNEVRLAEYRNGTVKSESVVETTNAITDWTRYAGNTNWYNVGETNFVETFTESVGSDQRNKEIGKVAPSKDRGAENANKSITACVKADTGAGNLSLTVGSYGVRTLGRVEAITRQKTHTFGPLTLSTTDTWVPIHAFRVDPNRKLINVQLTNTDITEFSGSGDLMVMPLAVDPSKTDASSFGTPVEHNAVNSAIEVTSSVSTFPDSTGTETSSATNPGGYQLGFSSWYSSGTGSKKTVVSGSRTRKRHLSHGDVCVVVAKATTTGDITGEIITEQDW